MTKYLTGADILFLKMIMPPLFDLPCKIPEEDWLSISSAIQLCEAYESSRSRPRLVWTDEELREALVTEGELLFHILRTLHTLPLADRTTALRFFGLYKAKIGALRELDGVLTLQGMPDVTRQTVILQTFLARRLQTFIESNLE